MISVIVPCKNRIEKLEKCINSIIIYVKNLKVFQRSIMKMIMQN